MLNSVAAGRRQARQIVVMQAAVTLGLASVFALQGWAHALAALLGGLSVVIGSALMGWRAFAGDVAGPGVVLLRLAGGVALKWLVIVLSLYLGLARYGLPPTPLLVGLCAALVASLLAYRIES